MEHIIEKSCAKCAHRKSINGCIACDWDDSIISQPDSHLCEDFINREEYLSWFSDEVTQGGISC